MADHRVNIQLPETELGRADTIFKVKKDNKLLGTIHISHGAFEYRPSGWSEKNRIKIKWTEFHNLILDVRNK